MELTGNVSGMINLGGGGGSTVEVTPILTSGEHIADIEVDGVTSELYAPEPTEPTEVEVTPILTSGEHIADIEVDGVTSELYAPESEIIYSTEERLIGTWMGKPLYIKSYHMSSISGTYTIIDSSINSSTTKIRASEVGTFSVGGSYNGAQYVDGRMSSGTFARIMLINSGLQVGIENAPVESITDFDFTIKYTKNTD